MPIKVKRQALRVALIYVCVAGCWILLSDELLKWSVSNTDLRTLLSIGKGWAFVLVSGGLVFVAVQRLLHRAEVEIQQREQAEAARVASVEKLRQNEAQLRLVLEASADGLWDWNLRTGVAELSPRYWEIAGYAMGTEVANLEFLRRLIHPEDWPRVEKLLQELFSGHAASCQIEHRLITKNGAVKWIWQRGKVVERAPGGRALRMVGTASDITEHKQVEAELAKARAYYRSLLETSADGIHVINQQGQLIEANAAFYRMLGYPPENPPTLKITDWEIHRSWEQVKAEMAGLLYAPAIFETLHRRQDGRVILVEVMARRIEIDGQSCFYASSRDITERKLAQEKLRESEEKFFKIFQTSPVSLSLCTMTEGRYLDVNEEFLRMIHRQRPEAIGRTALEIGVWEDAAQRSAVVDLIQKFGCVRNVELAIHTGAGETRYIMWSAEATHLGTETCLLETSLDITDRKLAEQRMRESEERYRQLFELESDAVILVDAQSHQFVDVNQSAQRLYGYSREEFLQMTVEMVSAEPELTRTAVGSGQGFIPLRWHRKKSGERFAVEITANLISHQGRRTELATLRDITVRQHVMDVLGETTGQLLEAQRIAGCGSYVFDITTGFWTGSEVLSDIFGLPEPGLTRDANGWLEIVHPEDREIMHDHLYEDVLKNHSPFDRIYRIIRRNDQQERWVHGLGKLIFNEQGKVTRMVGIIQDITDRKRNEDQMNVQFSALTAAANAILITDRRGRIEWVNPAFSKLTGYSAEEAVGKNPRLLNSGQHSQVFFANLWNTVLAGNVWHGEMVNRRKDGELYTEDTTITPVRNADGQVAHFVSIKQDVTERRQLEKRMLQAQKMEAIGTLAGGIAHDFNNILAAMFGYAYLLQQDTEGNPAAQENIEEILKATGRAKDLVQQILTFSRQREQKPQLVQLDSIVREAVRFLRASLPSQIKIELNLVSDAPAVLADPTQIYQVVINLATNALHAMEGRAGRLTIGLESFPPDARFLQLHPNFRPGPCTLLTVADTGQGMDVKTMERIFEPFFTTKPVGKGTGLGLSVVHGIVESHQGAISVDSMVGCGTTFRLYFPGQEDAATLKEAPNAEVPAGNGQHVLLLDDEPALTTALERLLIRLNYQVSISNSAREAINRFSQAPVRYDLVITDLTMPEMSGLEVSRQLRQLRPDLPIILTSGFSADVNHENLAAAGICEVLPKPLSWNDLAEILHRVLSRSTTANGNAGK